MSATHSNKTPSNKPSKRPEVVAHRGASYEHAEHTLRAYLTALDAGAEALECDVRLTADGHLICVHDRTLRRTANHPGIVSTMHLSELDQLDFASWKNPLAIPPSPDAADDHELDENDRILTMRRLLEAVVDYTYAHGRRVELAIETKHPVRYGGLVERRLVELLAEFDMLGPDSPVRVMSFSFNAVRRIRRLAPNLRVVMLIEKARHWPAIKRGLGRGWILGPGVELLQQHPQLAKEMAATGRELHVWTVNTADELQTCLDLGVSAVISDRPAFILELLGPDQTSSPDR